MITLPEGFTATKYPGYFFHVADRELYSIKIGGVMRKLKRINYGKACVFVPYMWKMECDTWCWQVSVKGHKKYLTDRYLYSLSIKDSVIEYEKIG